MSFQASQTNIVHELFVRTADDNYVAARWCAANELDVDFFWLGVHALEKYIKAVLLLNGHTSAGPRHDIVQLYASLQTIAGALLPSTLARPDSSYVGWWRELTPAQFVELMYRDGNPHGRYLIYGYVHHAEHVHMLDQMVFAIRRLICRLDDVIIPDTPASGTRRQHLDRGGANYRDHLGHMPLDMLIRQVEDSPRRQAALNLNFSFAPPGFSHTPRPIRSASRNPVLLREVLEPLQSADPSDAREGLALANWLLNNVTLPGDVQAQIGTAMSAARRRLGSP